MSRSHARRPRHSFAEYLEVEELSPAVKHEFVAGEIFAMAGGTIEHAALQAAVIAALAAQLRGTECRAYSSDLRIRISAVDVGTYADVAVVRDPTVRDAESPTHVTNPRVIVEVLSPSTEDYDREEKRRYYQTLDSLREYVLVAQDRRRVELWQRDGQSSTWTHSIHDASTKVSLPSIAATLDVDDLYEAAGVRVE